MTKQQLTREGYQKLQQELTDLRAKADHLVTQVEDVAQPDESGEDSLVSQLKAELEVVNSKIESLEEALENAEIINGHSSKTIVGVGSKVTIRVAGKVEKIFHVVSEFEADPSANKISDRSPLGRALIGKKVNQDFEIDAPVGKLVYKVVSIG